MKFVIFIGFLSRLCKSNVCCSQSTSPICVSDYPCISVFQENNIKNIYTSFIDYTNNYNKSFSSIEEFSHRLKIYAKNIHYLKENQIDIGEHNKFTDMTSEEFKNYHKLNIKSKPQRKYCNYHTRTYNPIPDHFDWRVFGVVADVKDQGQCGSCWTFSTVASIESANAIKNNKLTILSEQNLVDCVKGDVIGDEDKCCNGCSGGLMDNAFDYLIKKQDGGIDTEDSYPYLGKNSKCEFNVNNVGARILNWTDIPIGDENSMLDAIANVGVLSVALDASKQWQLYNGGILKPREYLGCSSDPGRADHGVAIVGYGSENGEDYWIIRNSWSKNWGENGYLRLIRGINACGVANYASYPIIV